MRATDPDPPSGNPIIDLALLLHSLPALVAYVDQTQCYQFNNRAYEEWFGPVARNLQGRHMRDVLGPVAYEFVRPHVERALSGERVEFEMTAPYRDGGPRDIHAFYIPHQDEHGSVRGFVAIVQDVSDKARAMRETQAAEDRLRVSAETAQRSREAAEAANRLKDEFLATVSHELRTPLNAIMGWARMLSMGALDESQRVRAIEIIERNAMIQQRIIEDILDVSRIISGKLRLDMAPIDLLPAIHAAVESVRPSAVARGVTLRTDLDASIGPVIGDSSRVQQIVWNLVSNAIKFTPRDGTVTVTLRRSDGLAEILVADTGRGIVPEFLPHVFDRFRQGDSSTTRQHGGLGLGLAIVRHLTELHGGSVAAYSEGDDRGATFVIRIPLTEAGKSSTAEGLRRPAVLSDSERSESTHRLDSVRILVVDDELDVRDLVGTVFSRSGADVRTAASSREALTILETWTPSVIVCDIAMPAEDGYTFIRELRSRKPDRGGAIPAAALTAYARPEDRERALAAGYQAHIVKPADPVELSLAIERLLRH